MTMVLTHKEDILLYFYIPPIGKMRTYFCTNYETQLIQIYTDIKVIVPDISPSGLGSPFFAES